MVGGIWMATSFPFHIPREIQSPSQTQTAVGRSDPLEIGHRSRDERNEDKDPVIGLRGTRYIRFQMTLLLRDALASQIGQFLFFVSQKRELGTPHYSLYFVGILQVRKSDTRAKHQNRLIRLFVAQLQMTTTLKENQVATLTTLLPLFAIFSFLLCVVFRILKSIIQIYSGFAGSAALVFWCLISSCLGSSIRQSLSQLWNYSVLGAMSQNNPRHSRSRHAYGEEEVWEMEYRGRAG